MQGRTRGVQNYPMSDPIRDPVDPIRNFGYPIRFFKFRNFESDIRIFSDRIRIEF